MLEEIKKRLVMTPFRPFSVRLVDGRELRVLHPETVWMPVPGVLHIWNSADGAADRVNPLLIVTVSGEGQWVA